MSQQKNDSGYCVNIVLIRIIETTNMYDGKPILSVDKLKSMSPEEVKNHFVDQATIDAYQVFFDTEVIQKLGISSLSKTDIKIFLTSFMVHFCPEQVMEFSESNPKTRKLTEAAEKATIFFEQFRVHVLNAGDTDIQADIKAANDDKMCRACGGMISKYNRIFKDWQKVDNNELIQTLKISYHNIKYSLDEFERHKKEVEESSDHDEMLGCIQHMTESMGKIKRRYIHAQRRNGVLEEQALEELEKITANELYMTLSDLEQMIKGAQNAFWDNFKKELTEDDFSRLPEILHGIKSALSDILSSTRHTPDDKFHNELVSNLDENFDVDFIKQMIDNNVFEPQKLIGYINYLSTIIKSLQAPEDDAALEQWERKVHEKLSPVQTNDLQSQVQPQSFMYSDVLPDILRDIFGHISLINKRLEDLRNLCNQQE